MSITSKPDPTVVSLFAGCGGSSLGYKQAGYDVRLAVEWDTGAADVYRRNFPETNVFEGDIADLTAEEALRVTALEPGELDVLDGSPPCQGFSTAGKRKFADTRNRLFEEYVRMLEVFKPKMLVIENVSGLRKGKMKLIFAEMTRALKDAGYKVSCRELNAWWYGVPQDRRRLIWVGVRQDLAPEPGHPEPTVTVPVSAGRALGAAEVQLRNPDFENKWKAGSDVSPALTNLAKQYWPIMRPGESGGKYHPKGQLFGLIKLNPERPAPTLVKHGGASNLCHWLYPRYLNCQEAALLQGFPGWFVFPDKVNLWRNLIGNSVSPPMARAIGRHLLTLLEEV